MNINLHKIFACIACLSCGFSLQAEQVVWRGGVGTIFDPPDSRVPVNLAVQPWGGGVYLIQSYGIPMVAIQGDLLTEVIDIQAPSLCVVDMYVEVANRFDTKNSFLIYYQSIYDVINRPFHHYQGQWIPFATWIESVPFGQVWVPNYPWVYDQDGGWLYVQDAGIVWDANAWWVYSFELNDWVWTTREVHPWAWSNNQQQWITLGF
jgi:hypothetical protein